METNRRTKRATIGMVLVSIAMLFTFLVPTQTADASGPCPGYSIQDVFADPTGNWDGDLVNNSDELYNGMNPCIPDTSAFCATGGISVCNYTYTYTNGYTYVLPQTYTPLAYVQQDVVNNPCHRSTFLFPLNDYDRDGVTNQAELNAGTDPCIYQATAAYYYTPVQALTIACPYYTADHITAAPSYDWDGDGVTNLLEWRQGTNPCVYNAPVVYQAPVQVQATTYRLPHVVNTYTPAPVVQALPAVQQCPAGYPYFHVNQCYANPVRGYFS